MRFTVFGAGGFIGGTLAQSLRAEGADVVALSRDDEVPPGPLGYVVYAIGITADFRERPFETLEAHVTLPARLLRECDFSSFLYLSSTRIYRHACATAEDTAISVNPAEPEDLYDLTKLMGEAVCHRSRRENVRVARLSNVIGEDFRSANFVFDLIRAAWRDGSVQLRSSLDSAKDYILVEDVVRMLPRIAVDGTASCYNLASGINLKHAEIIAPILQVSGATVAVAADAVTTVAPPVDITRVRTEFGFSPLSVPPALASLTQTFGRSFNA